MDLVAVLKMAEQCRNAAPVASKVGHPHPAGRAHALPQAVVCLHSRMQEKRHGKAPSKDEKPPYLILVGGVEGVVTRRDRP